MYIIVEFEELRDIIEKIERNIDPDTPYDEQGVTGVTLDRVTEMLDIILGQQVEPSDDVANLVCDDEIYERAARVVEMVLKRMPAFGSLEWMRVIDRFGGLVIRLKPGALQCHN